MKTQAVFIHEGKKAIIERQKELYKWEFIFLGANIDAAETAESMGIEHKRSADYISDKAGTVLNLRTMGGLFASLRAVELGSEEYEMSFDCIDEIRADSKRRGK